MGNQKLGESIHTWALPAVTTCPGRTALCSSVCYATKSRFLLPAVQERLAWCYEQSQRDDFVDRMVAEIRRKGCVVIRVHTGGDFYDASYAEKWLRIMRTCPRPRYYWYSRSWRSPEILPVLAQMALLKCCRAWFSLDAETGLPERVPRGVRLAYLQTVPDEEPDNIDLMFRVRRLRRDRALPIVCPNETTAGRSRDTNCGNCSRCWR
jgi:hypothetical protein